MPLDLRYCAAQYVRMSTDKQQYSIENQVEAIAKYAVERGITIVRTYEDAGKSGLGIERRDALRQLIADVRSGSADFTIVLVFDVSRWGRFQDSDESAYYEFICKQVGVRVLYCAEQFENDGSLTATILKNIRRAMAAEYSRDLSTKVFIGQCKIVTQGFHTGSTPGFGLRRVLVDRDGNRKFELAFGERKSLQTDRVILVPGPKREVKLVREVYRLFINERENLVQIARRFNARGLQNSWGRPWNADAIRDILTNEKYVGNCVYNRTSTRLGTKVRRNPRTEWVRTDAAIEPIITKELFAEAQWRVKNNNSCYTEGDLLNYLSAIWCRSGTLSVKILIASSTAPSIAAFARRFGNISNAFWRIGFRNPPLYRRARSLGDRKSIYKEIAGIVHHVSGCAKLLPGHSMLAINDELALGVASLLARSTRSRASKTLNYHPQRQPDILVIYRQDEESLAQDYFVIPLLLLSARERFTFTEGSYLAQFHVSSLNALTDVFAREPCESVAGRQTRHSAEADVVKNHLTGSSALRTLRRILIDSSFLELLRAEGVHGLPWVLTSAPEEDLLPGLVKSPTGNAAVRFVVAWAFVRRLLAKPNVAARLKQYGPGLIDSLQAEFQRRCVEQLRMLPTTLPAPSFASSVG